MTCFLKKISLLVIVLLVSVSVYPLERQMSGWYIGLQGGVPFAASSFSSIGENKTYMGWEGGVSAGYHFSRIFSLELSAMAGKTKMGTSHCCSNYFIDANGNRLLAPLSNGISYSYNDIVSEIFLEQYSLKANINFINIFRKSYSKWAVYLSPEVSYIRTNADVKTESTSQTLVKGYCESQPAAGLEVSASYNFNKHFAVKLASGAKFVFDKQFDGLPTHDDHNDNYIWNNTVSFVWRFQESKSRYNKRVARALQLEQQEAFLRAQEEAKRLAEQARKDSIEAAALEQEKLRLDLEAEAARMAKLEEERLKAELIKNSNSSFITYTTPDGTVIEFPSIYFEFNETWIERSEFKKANEIVRLLNEYPEAKIEIVGHADCIGTVEINEQISLMRAESVKKWCVKRGIDPDRITVRGAGIDYNPDRQKARRGDSSKKHAK